MRASGCAASRSRTMSATCAASCRRLRREQRMHADPAVPAGLLPRHARCVAHCATQHVVRSRQHLREAIVHPVHDRCRRAKIHRELQRLEHQLAEAVVADVEEQSDLRVAEAVDRLHRVADEEQRAPVAGLPAGRQRLQQSHLRLGGVLELVDQHVPQLRVERQRGVGRRVLAAERLPRRPREARVVGNAPLGEHQFEFGDGEAQHAELRPPAPAIRRRRIARRQVAHLVQQLHGLWLLAERRGDEARTPLEFLPGSGPGGRPGSCRSGRAGLPSSVSSSCARPCQSGTHASESPGSAVESLQARIADCVAVAARLRPRPSRATPAASRSRSPESRAATTRGGLRHQLVARRSSRCRRRILVRRARPSAPGSTGSQASRRVSISITSSTNRSTRLSRCASSVATAAESCGSPCGSCSSRRSAARRYRSRASSSMPSPAPRPDSSGRLTREPEVRARRWSGCAGGPAARAGSSRATRRPASAARASSSVRSCSGRDRIRRVHGPQRSEDAVAHLGRGLARKGDCEDRLGLGRLSRAVPGIV